MRTKSWVAPATGVSIVAMALSSTSIARAGEATPRMHPSATKCMRDANGEVFRVQCDASKKECLYAPDAEVDDDGVRVRPLDRIDACPEKVRDLQPLLDEGYAMVRGIPPAPYGWMRDGRGRVFQFNFDLHRRVYVGGGVRGTRDAKGNGAARGYVDFSLLEVEVLDEQQSKFRHRFRLVEGEVRLAPFEADVTAFRYDTSARRRDPLLRVTTFFGKPRRGDLHLNVGFYGEVGHVEILPVGDKRATVARDVLANVTLDLFQTRDLYSYVRLRAGASFDQASFPGSDIPRAMLTPDAAAEADVTLDRNGFHRVTGKAIVELPQSSGDLVPGQRRASRRLKAELGYEVITLALNDQPVTLRFAAGVSQRDDVPGFTTRPIAYGNLGLRINLWAPARQP